MHHLDFSLSDLAPYSWHLSEDQRALVAASQRFAREKLEPLLSQPPSEKAWHEIVEQAGALDLGTMILPLELGGMAINHHDLSCILGALACGPIERAVQLTQSIPALMTLRAHAALQSLGFARIGEYFDGTRPIALTVPDFRTATLWRLCDHTTPSALTLIPAPAAHGVTLVESTCAPSRLARQHVTCLGALTLEQLRCDDALYAAALVTLERLDAHGVSPTQTWLTNTALYLSALLSGTMQHGVTFALSYGAERQAFRKPLVMHQRVATRLADMLIAVQGTQLFVRMLALAQPGTSLALVRQLARHVAAESVEFTHELVQFCGAHGYVEGLAPAARLATCHWFAMLLRQVDVALGQLEGLSSPATGAQA
ncbi:acyl-CoA dehydrogenase [Burkholderia sp. HI2761]|uniref:acyl-CoA dehydrogenase family protein n=1 Tax=unclassified Burkholderia TaxID=2613784 RepID=UPI000B79C192|nr:MULTISPECIES: acyl-CoA dehydrogenase family protein [unclassified Burkholderia]MPV57737.1 acyl-CoA dehydrogenase [Burkholderia sp. BE24]OXJ23259.1 acyl-CoA dehydrogenase [Burkholderia sp. HI2761]